MVNLDLLCSVTGKGNIDVGIGSLSSPRNKAYVVYTEESSDVISILERVKAGWREESLRTSQASLFHLHGPNEPAFEPQIVSSSSIPGKLDSALSC